MRADVVLHQRRAIIESTRKRIKEGALAKLAGEQVIKTVNDSVTLATLLVTLKNSDKDSFTPKTLPNGFTFAEWDVARPTFFRQLTDSELKAQFNVQKFELPRGLPVEGLSISHIYHGMVTQAFERMDDDSCRRYEQRRPIAEDDDGVMYWRMEPIARSYLKLGYECKAKAFCHNTSPHIFMLCDNYCKAELGPILKGDLVVLADAMRRGTINIAFSHNVIPILLISIRVSHFRVIEAHFDGKQIHLRYGPKVEISYDIPPAKLQERAEWLLRWFRANPQGDTQEVKLA